MYSKTLYKTVGEIISQQRMLSVHNLISIVEIEMDQIQEILNDYVNNHSIRIGHSKSCSSDCSTCTTCSADTSTTIKETDIIISLLLSRTEEYADE
ncbi:MAG TPA: hypothetical protein VHO70_03310 [Chitinispirillaceae bacterium]|nr:hypothetical protein [Chitinispirillaceae bacterium]